MNNKFRVFEINDDEPDFSMMEDASLSAFADEIEESLSESGWIHSDSPEDAETEKTAESQPEVIQESETSENSEPVEDESPEKEDAESKITTSVESESFWNETADEIAVDSKDPEIKLILSEEENTEDDEIKLDTTESESKSESESVEEPMPVEPQTEEVPAEIVEEIVEEISDKTTETLQVDISDETETDHEEETSEQEEVISAIEGVADDDFYHHFGDLKLSERSAPKDILADSLYVNYDAIEEDFPEETEQTKKASTIKLILSWVLTIFIAFLVAILVNIFVIRPSEVSGESMKPTLQHGDTVILSRVPYMFSDPNRGDVIVIDSRIPTGNEEKRTVMTLFSEALKHNIITKLCGVQEPDYFWIKRVIGIPGDEIEFRDNCVYRNGEALEEPYINEETITSYPNGVSVEVPAGYVYVLGDNRNHSSDSRVIGLVPYENIIGKMIGQL